MGYQTLINSNIKRLRKDLNLTQERFAEIAEISPDTLRNLERDRYAPNPATIDKICSAFNLTPLTLLLSPISLDKTEAIKVINQQLEFFEPEELLQISEILKIIKKISK